MNIFKLVRVLKQIQLLSPRNLFGLLTAFYRQGVNLMMLADFANQLYGQKPVLTSDKGTTLYSVLFTRSQQLSTVLYQSYGIKKGKKIAFLCKNDDALILSLFAGSRLGADLYLLNAELGRKQFLRLVDHHNFDLLVYGEELEETISQALEEMDVICLQLQKLVASLSPDPSDFNGVPRTFMGKLVLMTGGTTGHAKEAQHKISLFAYLHPFAAIITQLNLLSCRTAYIATPLYHGYGIAVLLIFFVLGKHAIITKEFHEKEACRLVDEHQAEVMTAVPLMVHKMLQENREAMQSLKCIASGGAELNPQLVKRVAGELGPVLFNLYGTSETGLNTIAGPEDLAISAKTIGKAIEGVTIRIMDADGRIMPIGEIGQLHIKNRGAVSASSGSWIATGDLGYSDKQNYYFLAGRTDDRIVSAGENVYPHDLAAILFLHPAIEDLAVVGVSDPVFGQRLKAFIQLKNGVKETPEEIKHWLKGRAARFQMPKELVIVDQLPYTAIGKLDKKILLRNEEAISEI